MSDPRVPPDEQIGEPEGVDPDLTSDADNTPAEEREEEEANELLEEEDVDLPEVVP